MNYHVVKASRVYSGQAYRGPTMHRAGYSSCEFNSIGEACKCADEMAKLNGVGFDVYCVNGNGTPVYKSASL